MCQRFCYGNINQTINGIWSELISSKSLQYQFIKTYVFRLAVLVLIRFSFQNSLRSAKSSPPLMFSMMLWKVRNTEHGRKSTSRLCWSTWNSAWISARVIWQKKDCTSTRIFASRYGFWIFCCLHSICQLTWLKSHISLESEFTSILDVSAFVAFTV